MCFLNIDEYQIDDRFIDDHSLKRTWTVRYCKYLRLARKILLNACYVRQVVPIVADINMIIRFAVENWRSFRNRAELDMTATRERQHSDRLSVSAALGVKLLPVTAIFGANASGKTKFVEALSFAQRYIVEGVPSNAQIAVRPFKLDVEMEKKPSTFEFDLLINDLIYSFKFILSSSCVIEEMLTVQNSYAAYEIYSRKANEPMTFGSKLLKDVDEGVLRVLEGGIRENMLFLTNAIGQKVKSPLLNALYSWFEKELTVITPHSRYTQIQRLADQSDVMTDGILRLLKALDTGIDHLEEVVDYDFERKLLAEQLQSIQNDLAQQRGVIRCNENSVLMREGGKTVLKKLARFINEMMILWRHLSCPMSQMEPKDFWIWSLYSMI